MNTPAQRFVKSLGFSPADLLTPEQAANALRRKTATLAAWRRSRRGPAWVKCGASVRYRRADILEWLESNAPASGEAQEQQP